MNETRRANEIEAAEARAAEWLARLNGGTFDDVDVLAFDRWLEDPVNRDAFERAEALWLDLEDISAGSPSSVAQLPKPAARRRAPWPWVAGLAAAASVVGAVLFVPGLSAPPAPVVFEAARGESRKVDLADGSHVHLGGGSRLVVSLARSERRVELGGADGEAAFDVAKDPSRPFVIVSGDHSITVVGTEFDVRRAAGRLMVTVRRGVVEVASLAPGSRPVRLTPGQEYSHKDGSSESHVTAVDPAAAFGWTTGERTYRGQPLAEVVADLNRYFTVPIQVDAGAADLRFTGFLKVDEEEAVVRRLQAFLPIVVERSPNRILLRHAPG